MMLDVRDVPFSLSPDGLEEFIEAMRGTVHPEPYDGFADQWAKVARVLSDARSLATVGERRVLARLEALLQIGEWHATALDLLPHPKLHGLCLVFAKDCPRGYPWEFLLAAGDWVQEDCIKVRKVLSTLAWHLSTRESRHRKFVWCRDAAAMVQRLLRRWRQERRKGCDAVQRTMRIQYLSVVREVTADVRA